MTTLRGAVVTLRTATGDDVEALVAIRSTPEVRARWDAEIDEDVDAAITGSLADPELHVMVIELDAVIVGSIQWSEDDDPMYRHADMDIFVDPAVHGRGVGTDAVRTLSRHLVRDHGHHRLVIDPAADNVAAIRCYAKVGFRAVGVMRQYERGSDGTWHDGLLMDLVADDLLA
jgi:aminoglycoside 6'-N-acetyltransferase